MTDKPTESPVPTPARRVVAAGFLSRVTPKGRPYELVEAFDGTLQWHLGHYR